MLSGIECWGKFIFKWWLEKEDFVKEIEKEFLEKKEEIWEDIIMENKRKRFLRSG